MLVFCELLARPPLKKSLLLVGFTCLLAIFYEEVLGTELGSFCIQNVPFNTVYSTKYLQLYVLKILFM